MNLFVFFDRGMAIKKGPNVAGEAKTGPVFEIFSEKKSSRPKHRWMCCVLMIENTDTAGANPDLDVHPEPEKQAVSTTRFLACLDPTHTGQPNLILFNILEDLKIERVLRLMQAIPQSFEQLQLSNCQALDNTTLSTLIEKSEHLYS